MELKGKYVVYRHGERGFRWGRVSGSDDKQMWGVNERGLPYETDSNFEVPLKDLVSVLGRNPVFGTSYGQKIEPFLKTIEVDGWGQLHLFVKLQDEDRDALKTGLKKALSKLKYHGLTGFLPVDIEVRNPRGRWAGMYQFQPKEERDTILLHPKAWQNVPLLLLHEAAHGVWFRLMGKKAKSKWIELYHHYVKVKDCDSRVVRELRTNFCGQDVEGIKDFRGQLEEDVVPVFDACIEHIQTHHSLNVKALDMLILSGDGKFVSNLWPTSQVLHTDYEYPVSEYAATKPEEFFAEAVSMYLTGTKFPSRISSLIENTLRQVAGRKA